MRIWDYARSGYEIARQNSIRLIGNEPGLVGYWRFDEGAGNTVFDQTDRGYDGTIYGNAQWVASEAPIGDSAGIPRSSFSLTGRTLVGSLAAKLYYQQEEQATGYDNNRKPMKKNARVMVTTATQDSSGNDPAVATLDLAVSREGRLARLPDAITLPVLEKPQASNDLTEITNLEKDIRNLTDEMDELSNEIAELELDVARIPSVTAEKETLNNQKNQLLQQKVVEEKNYMNYWCKLKLRTTGTYMKTSADNHYIFLSNENNDNTKWKFENWTGGRVRLRSKVRNAYLQSGDKNERCFCLSSIEHSWWTGFYLEQSVREYVRLRTYSSGLYVFKQYSGNRLVNHNDRNHWNAFFTIVKTSESCNNVVSNLQTQYNRKLSDFNVKVAEYNSLLAKQNLLSQKQALKLEKENLLQAKEDQLGVLTGGAQNEIRLPMGLLHIDASGLTVNGSLMKFATAIKTPTLLDGSTGELILYYPDNSGQFMVAYFQALVARTQLQFPNSGLTLFASVAGKNPITATISGGRNDICNLVITNSDRGITETWTNLPRDPQQLANILNGTGERPERVTATIVPATYSVKKRSMQVLASVSNNSSNVTNGEAAIITGREAFGVLTPQEGFTTLKLRVMCCLCRQKCCPKLP
ncbi:MAG: hypothetical protein F6K08_23725 [Okeania sp. SIO1H6]|nr:hypothetical protein [Okeania sp. SIO1H6]